MSPGCRFHHRNKGREFYKEPVRTRIPTYCTDGIVKHEEKLRQKKGGIWRVPKIVRGKVLSGTEDRLFNVGNLFLLMTRTIKPVPTQGNGVRFAPWKVQAPPRPDHNPRVPVRTREWLTFRTTRRGPRDPRTLLWYLCTCVSIMVGCLLVRSSQVLPSFVTWLTLPKDLL